MPGRLKFPPSAYSFFVLLLITVLYFQDRCTKLASSWIARPWAETQVSLVHHRGDGDGGLTPGPGECVVAPIKSNCSDELMLARPKPLMSDKDLLLWETTVRNSSHYFEFGLGASTIAAVGLHIPKITAVDSDLTWVTCVRDYIQRAMVLEDSHKVDLVHVNIGPTGDWGHPTMGSCRHLWNAYPHAIESYGFPPPDVVFVDGRFRVASALVAMVHCGPDVTVVMHDFTIREQYKHILTYVDVVETAETLVVLRRKAGVRDKVLQEAIAKYQYDSA
jgi:hypothetical protein